MEPTNQESAPQKERRIETILPPEVIRPLGRALKQRFWPDLETIQDSIDQLKSSPDIGQSYKDAMQNAINEFNDRLLGIERAKEVKLIKEGSADIPIWGIECSEELEDDAAIPPSTTVIKKAVLKKLAPALQDYLMGPIGAGRPPTSLILPEPLKKYLDEIFAHTQEVRNVLRALKLASRITIVSNERRSDMTIAILKQFLPK